MAAEILKSQLVGHPADTYAHNGDEDPARCSSRWPGRQT
jgi:hypothetical protein